MSEGIQLEVQVSDASDCPLLSISEDTSGRLISKSHDEEQGTVREILEVDSSVDLEDLPAETKPLFSKESNNILLYERPACKQCPCECVEGFGSPVAEAFTDYGSLSLRVYLQEIKTIREIVSALEEDFEGIQVNHLIRTDTDLEGATQDIGFVDRGHLTNRQREALNTALRMGYFDYPRQANASEVAASMEINRSTLVEHLSRAQAKLLGDLFDC